MLIRAQHPRVHWSLDGGWVVDSPIALNRGQLMACVAYTKRVQGQRIKTMRGDKREQMIKALSELSVATLKVHLLPESGFSGGERVLYKPDRG